MKTLLVKELIEQLTHYPSDSKVLLFSEGESYPALQVSEFEGSVEIAGGWERIDFEEGL